MGFHAGGGGENTEDDADAVLAMQIAMVFSVVGRQSELGFTDNQEAHTRYRNASVEALKSYLSRMPAGLISPRAQEAVLRALLHMSNPRVKAEGALGASMQQCIGTTHALDLFRCKDPAGMNDLADGEISACVPDTFNFFFKRNKLLCLSSAAAEATGDRMNAVCTSRGWSMATEAPLNHHRGPFLNCSTDPAHCWAVVNEAHCRVASCLTGEVRAPRVKKHRHQG